MFNQTRLLLWPTIGRPIVLFCIAILATSIICVNGQQQQQQNLTLVSAQPTNHQIRFLGIKNGFENSTEARFELESILRNFTKANVVIDYMDDNNVYWHSVPISQLPGCPETEILNLYSSIKFMTPEEEYFTREFKLYLTEDFEPPKTVSIEWLGACGNVGRKRSEPTSGGSSEIFNNSNSDSRTGAGANQSLDKQIASNDQSSILTSSNESPVSTTTTTTTSTTTVEPKEPTTTIEPATSIAPLDVESSTPLASSESGNLFKSIFGPSLLSLSDANATLLSSPSPTTTTTATPATTVTEEEDEELVASPTESTTTTTTTKETPPREGENVTLSGDSDNDKMSPLMKLTISNSTELLQPTTTTTPPPPTTTATVTTTTTITTTSSAASTSEIITTTAQPDKEATTATSSNKSGLQANSDGGVEGSGKRAGQEEPERHYGKYVGLTAGFVLVVGYVICSRAYRRQSQMYELHND